MLLIINHKFIFIYDIWRTKINSDNTYNMTTSLVMDLHSFMDNDNDKKKISNWFIVILKYRFIFICRELRLTYKLA